MTTIDDRCTCYQELTKHVGDSFAKFQITEKDEGCSVHGDLDAILASGEYFDRKGELWHLCDCPAEGCGNWHMHHPSRGITPAQMRLLIERDMHRDVCPGLLDCANHPAQTVIVGCDGGEWRDFRVLRAGGRIDTYDTLPAAMDAARALAVDR